MKKKADIVADPAQYVEKKRSDRLAAVSSLRLADVVVLENIHDPHNAAAALRNCDAFGIQTVHVIFETEKIFNPHELGKLTSASANKWVTIRCWETTESCFSYLKAEGFTIAATLVDAQAKPLPAYTFKGPTALVFGNEGFGISDYAKTHADHTIYIPMRGFVESLNLSVSVGIALYDLHQKRGHTAAGLMPAQERDRLYHEWVAREVKKKYRV